MDHNEKVHWCDSYLLGIKLIDNEHKKLFELVNELYNVEDGPNVKEKIRKILYSFSDYTAIHFKDEEEFMKSISYPDLEEHKKIHQMIIENLSHIIHTPATLGIIKSKMKIVAKRILIEHILNEDMKISRYIQDSPHLKEKIYDVDGKEMDLS